MQLKHNETYTIEITAVRYSSGGWNHNSLYLEVVDQDGAVVSNGHLLEYHRNASTVDYETSDYQIALTVTQTPQDGYTTTVTAQDGATVNLGQQTYSFQTGKGNTISDTSTVSTAPDSFTFHSSTGGNHFVGSNRGEC